MKRIAVLLACAVGTVSAQEPGGKSVIDLGAGVTTTDNAARTSGGETDDTIASIGMDIDVARHGRKLHVVARADLDWVEYLDDSFDGRALGYFDGHSTWGDTEDLLQWVVRETFGQLRDDPFAAATPANVENINYFSTGPTFNFRLGGAAHLSLFGLYSNAAYETSPYDSDQLSGGVSFKRLMSRGSIVSLNAGARRVEFDDSSVNSNFDTQEAYVSYELSGSRTTGGVDLGYTVVNDRGESDDGVLLRLDLARAVSAASNLYLRGGREYATAADALRTDAGPGAPGIGNPGGPGLASADPIERTFAEAGWTFGRRRTSFSVGATWRDEQHTADRQLDRSVAGFAASFLRRMRPTLNLRVSGRMDFEGFDNIDLDNEESSLTAELVKDVGRRLGVSLQYQRYSRSSSDAPSTEYTENRAGLQLTYSLADRR